ncbi:probable E3 ubiquitin-protein ligase BAH1-like isoform X2 [Salvia miltiorrhiza]|uniref:probable E3 ubiquitin-protein ligase BAH1-like isoform X2 n=1 Tax=Salvia miltiorrhiza TaxID=226208 RepID=UPI0025ABFD6D|nr:probable E3 ubiquitin-protein ligase BAH1-like isoform X2 [Salvia miltiorrhiza]
MKFGEKFSEYLETNQERFVENCRHVEYKRLKKVLKRCRRCRAINDSPSSTAVDDNGDEAAFSQFCQFESCQLCDQKFFSELMKEAIDIGGCFSSRVRQLLQFHIHGGAQRYFTFLRYCFVSPQQKTAQECRMLTEYVMMNAVAMRKILKKYDKIHSSANGSKFKSKMRAEHMEILQSPWLIELGAFCKNFNQPRCENSSVLENPFSFDLTASGPTMTLILPDSIKLEYDLTCAICLDLVFNPYALGCGHLFCKSCACSAASVMIFQGLKAANTESKCPVCREVGVYTKAVHMMELDLLLKKDRKEYWKERLVAERADMVKQSKEQYIPIRYLSLQS